MCGIAYEVLYARLLTTYLGDMFHVNAAILVSFLLGIGIGSFWAHRWLKHLWAIEVAIGLYALGVAAIFGRLSFGLLHSVLPMTSKSPLLAVAFLAVALAAPAILVGFSIPLFAETLRAQRPEGQHTFHDVYGVYNLGAAACVLVIEFALLRKLGVRGSLVVLAGVNVLNGALLRLAIPGPPYPAPPQPPVSEPEAVLTLGPGNRRALSALFIASAASGVYQLFVLKVASSVFGPFHENFAMVLAFGLLGLTSGAWLVARRTLSLSSLLVPGGAAIALTFVCMEPTIELWANLNQWLGFSALAITLLKGTGLAVMAAVPMTVVGAMVPAVVGRRTDPRSGGVALGVSCLGNCLGYLATVLFLYEHLSIGALAVLIPLVLILCGLLASPPGAHLRVRTVAALATLPLVWFAWPERLLHVGFINLVSPRALALVKQAISCETVRKYDSEVSLLKSPTGQEFMILNGYGSVEASTGSRTNTRELLVGSIPALYSAEHDAVMVLGIGTGITAGAAAQLYRHTTGVELNPAVFEVLPRFAAHNFGLHPDANVSLVLDDGISALAASDATYDAIINTVTSPLYFSSSKLYTKDFFDLAASRLRPGGVYAFWFDSRATRLGAQIIFRTAAASFAACHLVYLDSGYAQVICSKERLEPRRRTWPPALEMKFGAGTNLNLLAEALIFPRHGLFDSAANVPLNTLDLPALEFIMSAAALSLDERPQNFSPFQMLDADLGRSAFQESALSVEQLADRCYRLRAWAEQPVPFCTERLIKPGEHLPDAYLVPTLKLPPEALRSAERLSLLTELRANGHSDWALPQLEAMDPRARRWASWQYLRAQTIVDLEGDLPDAQLEQLFLSDPLSPQIRQLIAQLAGHRGLLEAAKGQLMIAERLGLHPVSGAADAGVASSPDSRQ